MLSAGLRPIAHMSHAVPGGPAAFQPVTLGHLTGRMAQLSTRFETCRLAEPFHRGQTLQAWGELLEVEIELAAFQAHGHYAPIVASSPHYSRELSDFSGVDPLKLALYGIVKSAFSLHRPDYKYEEPGITPHYSRWANRYTQDLFAGQPHENFVGHMAKHFDYAWLRIIQEEYSGSARPLPPADPKAIHLPGITFSSFLGEGGSGMVFKGTRTSTGETVAVKFLKQEQDPYARVAQRIAFLEEAKIRQFDHPHIVKILDIQIPPFGPPYIVMEHVPGGDLEMYRKALPSNDPHRREQMIRQLLIQILDGLEYLHERRMIHRDMKPQNVLMGKNGAKITDFGIALSQQPGHNSVTVNQSMGTPGFASPEHYKRRLGLESDLFGVAAIAYSLMTGHAPYGDDSIDYWNHIYPGLQKPQGISDGLWAVIKQGLHPTVENRFRTARAMREAIEGKIAAGSSPHPTGGPASPAADRPSAPHPLLSLMKEPEFPVLIVGKEEPIPTLLTGWAMTPPPRWKITLDPDGNTFLDMINTRAVDGNKALRSLGAIVMAMNGTPPEGEGSVRDILEQLIFKQRPGECPAMQILAYPETVQSLDGSKLFQDLRPRWWTVVPRQPTYEPVQISSYLSDWFEWWAGQQADAIIKALSYGRFTSADAFVDLLNGSSQGIKARGGIMVDSSLGHWWCPLQITASVGNPAQEWTCLMDTDPTSHDDCSVNLVFGRLKSGPDGPNPMVILTWIAEKIQGALQLGGTIHTQTVRYGIEQVSLRLPSQKSARELLKGAILGQQP